MLSTHRHTFLSGGGGDGGGGCRISCANASATYTTRGIDLIVSMTLFLPCLLPKPVSRLPALMCVRPSVRLCTKVSALMSLHNSWKYTNFACLPATPNNYPTVRRTPIKLSTKLLHQGPPACNSQDLAGVTSCRFGGCRSRHKPLLPAFLPPARVVAFGKTINVH